MFWNIEKTELSHGGAGRGRSRAGGRAAPCSATSSAGSLATIPVMLVVAVLVFLMLRLTAGDPAAIIAGDNATTEQVAEIRDQLGLDQPIVKQFVIWIGNVAARRLSASRSSSRSRWPS